MGGSSALASAARIRRVLEEERSPGAETAGPGHPVCDGSDPLSGLGCAGTAQGTRPHVTLPLAHGTWREVGVSHTGMGSRTAQSPVSTGRSGESWVPLAADDIGGLIKAAVRASLLFVWPVTQPGVGAQPASRAAWPDLCQGGKTTAPEQQQHWCRYPDWK